MKRRPYERHSSQKFGQEMQLFPAMQPPWHIVSNNMLLALANWISHELLKAICKQRHESKQALVLLALIIKGVSIKWLLPIDSLSKCIQHLTRSYAAFQASDFNWPASYCVFVCFLQSNKVSVVQPGMHPLTPLLPYDHFNPSPPHIPTDVSQKPGTLTHSSSSNRWRMSCVWSGKTANKTAVSERLKIESCRYNAAVFQWDTKEGYLKIPQKYSI